MLAIRCRFIRCTRLHGGVEPRLLQKNLGKVIRNERAVRGFSQESFAHEVGVHRTYMGAIERGEQNVGVINLARIANALGTPLSELFVLAEELRSSPHTSPPTTGRG